MQIIDAVSAHLPAITAIHNEAVQRTTAIWNDTVVTVEDRAAWLQAHRDAGLPVLAAVDAAPGEPTEGAPLLGYATYGPFRPHDGYRRTVEHSVYVDGTARGRGIGTALMHELLARARAQGVHVMVAAIDADNTGSIRIHERLGFAHVGLMPQVGEKFGRWLDLALLQLVLDDRPAPVGADEPA
ncbi:N-acetyltransferase family protein [Brachybacterium sp. DNPG3]